MNKTLKLTKKTAAELIGRICPKLPITKDDTPPYVQIYRAYTGPMGLMIVCENDWMLCDNRIRLTISACGQSIVQFYNPDTLDRDFAAEDKYLSDTASEARMIWVNDIGQQKAHELVDRYWNDYR